MLLTIGVVSAGLRGANGLLLLQSGDHRGQWDPPEAGRSTPTHTSVPIFQNERLWGSMEVRFEPLGGDSLMAYLESPLVRLTGNSKRSMASPSARVLKSLNC